MKIFVIFLCFGSRYLLSNTNTLASSEENNQRIEMLDRVGSIYFQEGDLDAALDVFNRILAIDQYHKKTLVLKGLIFVSTARYKEAIENMTALVKDYPNDYQAMNNLAWVYATSEDKKYRNAQLSVELAQKALVLSPYDHHVWSTLSEAYYVAGDYEKANRAILHLVKLSTSKGAKMSQDMVDTYNKQIRKCQRAIEAELLLKDSQ